MDLEEAHKISYENGDQAGNARERFLPIVSRIFYYATGAFFFIWWLYAHLDDLWAKLELDPSGSRTTSETVVYLLLYAAAGWVFLGTAFKVVSTLKKKGGSKNE